MKWAVCVGSNMSSPRWFQVSTTICSQDCKSDLCSHIRGYKSIACCPKVWVAQQCMREMAHKHLRARTAWWCDVCSWCALLAWKGPKKVDAFKECFPYGKKGNVGPLWDLYVRYQKIKRPNILKHLPVPSPLRKESAEKTGTASPETQITHGRPLLLDVASVFWWWIFLKYTRCSFIVVGCNA